MKFLIYILVGFTSLVGGIAIGMAVAYSPLGFPGTFAPPAPQGQKVVGVERRDVSPNDAWLNDVNTYLVPFNGIKGNRAYSALILLPNSGKNITVNQKTVLYLESKELKMVQPIIITASDFGNGTNPVVKLLDQGPNSGQYYQYARGFTLSSQPHLKNW